MAYPWYMQFLFSLTFHSNRICTQSLAAIVATAAIAATTAAAAVADDDADTDAAVAVAYWFALYCIKMITAKTNQQVRAFKRFRNILVSIFNLPHGICI